MYERQMTEEEANERRVAPRVRTLKRARLMFNNRFSTIDCVVRNVSATGALLTVDNAVQLPRVFEIRIGEEGEIRPAKLVYRREMFAGIHFLDKADTVDGAQARTGEDPGRIPQDMDGGDFAEIERIEPRPLPTALIRHFAWFA